MWNERYSKPDFLFGTEPAQFLRNHVEHLKSGKAALAIADGEGRNSVFMAQQKMQVTAFDYAPNAIAKAKGLAQKNNVEVNFCLSDIESWPWEESSYDLVAAIFIQFIGPQKRKILFANMKKTLKPGGILLLHGYTPKQIEFGTGGPKTVENLYTLEQLQTDFKDMDILTLRTYEVEVDEGKGHSGMSALIDLVARKR